MKHTRQGQRDYVQAVLELYVTLPETRDTPSRQDRRLAGDLYQRGAPRGLVRAALLLAAARRTLRSSDAPALEPIGCLHYFLPVIDELTSAPPDPDYVEYLYAKLKPFLKTHKGTLSTTGQKTSLRSGR